MTEPGGDTDVGGIVAHFRVDGGPEGRRELEAIQRRAEALGRVNPTIRISSNAAELKAQADALMARMEALARLNPDIRIRSNSATVQADLASIRARMEALGAENTTLRFDLTAAQAQIEALRQRTGRQGGIAGRDFGAQFTRGLRETLASIPKVDIDGDTSDVDRQVQEVRAQLEELSKKRIGFDISAEEAMRSLAALQGELEALKAQASDVDVRFNTAAATARLARLRAQLGELGNADIGGGRFAAQLAKAIREATAALPKIDVDADSTPAQRKLAEIRARMVELGGQKIGVDITAAAAAAKLKALQEELDKLHRSARDDVRIRMDTAAASAKLAALRREMDGLSKAGAGGAGGMGGTGPLLLGAIVAAASLAGPALGAATAGAVALGGAVGVAALAYEGLKQAEKDETATGLKLQAQVKGIGGELGQLETIAANRMAPGVLGALGKVRAFIPTLDGPVAGLARHLGNALNIGTGGLITGLKVMTPLLDDAGNYAEHLAQDFANWTASGQFQQFINYARSELPIVGHDLADIGSAAIHLGVALQPYGDQLLHIIDLTSQAITKTSDLIALLNSNAGKSGGDNSDILGFQNRYQNSKDKKDKGVLDYLNIALGAGDPYANPGKAKAGAAQTAAQAAQSAQAQERVALYTRRVAEAIKAEEGAQQKLADRYGVTLPVMQGIIAASKKDADARTQAIVKMQQEGAAAGLLKAALDTLDGKQLSAAQTQNAFEQSLVTMVKATTKADGAVKGLSSSAIQNRANLLNSVTAAEAAAGAHGDLAKSSDAAKARLIVLRKQIIDNAVAHGEDRKAVTAYINTVLDIKKLRIPPTPLDVTKAAAERKITALQAQINAIRQGKPTGIAADTELAKRRLVALQAQIDRLQGKNIPVNITVNQSVGRIVHDAVNSIPVPGGHPPARAAGGTLPEGYSTINEQGWELLHKRGSQVEVIPHALAKQILPRGPSVPAFASGTDGIVTLTPHRVSSSSGTASPGASATTTPYEYDGIYYSTAIAAANARTRAQRRKPKEIIDSIVETAGKGAAYGIASYIRGQIPSVRQAAHLLSVAVDDAFKLKGAQATVARIRADLQKLRDQQTTLATDVTGKLQDGTDPAAFGSIAQYTAYLQAKAGQNNRFTGEIKHLERNKAIPADLLAKFAADGPSAALDSFAGASRRDVTALLRASAGFNASVTGGTRQAASIYGPAIAKDTANLNRALAQSARTEQAMIRATLTLARLVDRPVTLKVDGATWATTKYVNKTVQGVVDELRHVLVTD